MCDLNYVVSSMNSLKVTDPVIILKNNLQDNHRPYSLRFFCHLQNVNEMNGNYQPYIVHCPDSVVTSYTLYITGRGIH